MERKVEWRLLQIGILIVMVPGLLSTSSVAQETATSTVEGISENSIIMDVYISDSGRALVTGYVPPDSLGELAFLNGSEYVYDNDTSQIYAVTDALTSKKGGDWTLNLSFGGYFLDYSFRVFLPPEAELTHFSLPPGSTYALGIENSSILMEVQGFQAPSLVILISYTLPIGGVSDQTLPSRSWMVWLALIAAAVAIALYIWKYRPAHGGIPGEEEGVMVTPEMEKVMETLSEREQEIVRVLIKGGGSATQAGVRMETGIPKSSLSGILNALVRKNIVKKRGYGRTNRLELTGWFLGETDDKY